MLCRYCSSSESLANAAPNGDLVDGDLTQALELGLGIATTEVALLDVLDDVPTDAQVAGHIKDGRAPRQLQDVPLEGLGIAPPRVGEGDLDLTDDPAGPAGDAGDREDHDGGAATDGQRSEPPLDAASRSDVARAAGLAPQCLGLLPDGERHFAALIVSADILVAPDSEGVIQQAGGHAE